MSDAPDYVAIAEEDGAILVRGIDGKWFAADDSGITIIRGALSRAEAARLYCEDRELVPLTNEQILARIKAAYRPYDTLPEFQEGFDAYQKDVPHRLDPYSDGVKAQAWDRGVNTAMLYQRALDHLERHKSDVDKAGPGWLARLIRTGRC